MASVAVNGPAHFELNTGSKIPSVGLSTWKASPGKVGQAVIHAVKAGYRLIDCAAVYGNEQEIHWPIRTKPVSAGVCPENMIPLCLHETWAALEGLYASGQARAIGVSNFSTKKLEDLLGYAKVPRCEPG